MKNYPLKTALHKTLHQKQVAGGTGYGVYAPQRV